MSLPTVVLSGLTSLPVVAAPVAYHPKTIQARILPVVVPHQETIYWCWAAVASGIACFYGSSMFPQHIVAGRVLNRPCQINGLVPANCNHGAPLAHALCVTDNFWSLLPGSYPLKDVIRSINAGRPLCVRLRDVESDTGHFVVIYGYGVNGTNLRIADPAEGLQFVNFNQFVTAYRAIYEWSHTYETKPHIDPPHCKFAPGASPC